MTRRILYVETYDSGSHARVLEILRQCSRHAITAITLPPEHWRWRFIAAHHDVAAAIKSAGLKRPDAIVLSGPLDVPAMLAMLPGSWRIVPIAVYLHESQWTYPTQRHDTRPYVVGHLDALCVAGRVWFNSTYHRDEFRRAALGHMSPRIRKLAREVIGSHWSRTRVVPPPVRLDSLPPPRSSSGSETARILWAARWEQEKRPNRFVAAVERLRDTGVAFEVLILGAGESLHADPAYLGIADLVAVSGAAPSRIEYEGLLAGCDIVISTTDHEFFGVAMIEAALAGVIPILPNAHAYPEALPSAFFYPDGDIDALTRTIQDVLKVPWGGRRPWTSDARRFLPHNTVTAFDQACDELIESTGDTGN